MKTALSCSFAIAFSFSALRAEGAGGLGLLCAQSAAVKLQTEKFLKERGISHEAVWDLSGSRQSPEINRLAERELLDLLYLCRTDDSQTAVLIESAGFETAGADDEARCGEIVKNYIEQKESYYTAPFIGAILFAAAGVEPEGLISGCGALAALSPRERQEIESKIRAELEPQIRAELELQIRAELEPQIRAELAGEYEEAQRQAELERERKINDEIRKRRLEEERQREDSRRRPPGK